MSDRQRNSRHNKHVISYWWRGDVEEKKSWAFPTKEAAWAHVLGNVRKSIKWHESGKTTPNLRKTEIDWKGLQKKLFEKGHAQVVYCQCSAWWDNWEYFEKGD